MTVAQFLASNLLFVQAACAVPVASRVLADPLRAARVQWLVSVTILALVSVGLATVTPFFITVAPPVPTGGGILLHGEFNSFPSHHALVSALIVAGVLLARPRWTVPFLIMSAVIDWALVRAEWHQVVDISGAILFVGVGLATAEALAPRLSIPITRLMRTRTVATRAAARRTC